MPAHFIIFFSFTGSSDGGYRLSVRWKVSRKGANAPRFETEIRPFEVSVLFAASRLGVKDCFILIRSARDNGAVEPLRR